MFGDDVIGRTAELAELEKSVRPGRLVTLFGPGGVGKTRLAREVAARAEARFGGSVAFVDLSAARSRADLFEAIARALGLPARSELGDDQARLSHVLSARGPTLLVLDNFEQIVDAAAAPLAMLRSGLDSLALLVTSRERLAVEGERVLRVDPLPEEDAIALLRARSPEGLEDEPGRAIVRSAGRLPLAIELAAAQLDVLSPSQLAARLDRGYADLSNPRRDAPERHRTLEATVRWSWDLFDEEARRALACCAVFVQPFTLDDAEVVTGVSAATLAMLQRKCVLVARASGDVVRLGFAVAVKEFALARLAELTLEHEARAAHARHFLESAEQQGQLLLGPSEGHALRWLSEHRNEIVAAADWLMPTDPNAAARALLTLHPMLESQGPRELHEELLERAITLTSDPSIEARALTARGEHRWRRGRLEDARVDLRRALGDARGVDEGEASRLLGLIDQVQGRYAEAERRLEEAMAVFERLGDIPRIALTRSDLGALRSQEGRRDEAQALFEAALVSHEQRGAQSLVARELSRQGHTLARERRVREAIAKIEQAAQLRRELGDATAASIDEALLVLLFASIGELRESLGRSESALAEHAAIGNLRFEAILLTARGWCLLELGRWDEADDAFDKGRRFHRRVGDLRYVGYSTLGLAWSSRARGQRELARRLLLEAEGELECDASIQCHATALRVVVERELGTASSAHEALAARMEIERPNDAQHGLARPAYEALIAAASGRSDEARSAAEKFSAQDVGRVSTDLRILRAALDDALDLSGPVLSLDEEERRFRIAGEVVDLAGRETLWRIVVALARQRLEAPGAGLSPEAVQAAGWPGEKVVASAGLARVRTALRTLRDLGLRDALVTSGRDYRVASHIWAQFRRF